MAIAGSPASCSGEASTSTTNAFLRMMREDNLLCVRRRVFMVTTDSRHNLPVYPNLARKITPMAINQLWIADITYIRLRTEFVYLSVVLDAFSRRVIGWALGRTLEAGLAIAALRMALIERRPSPGLVHHSDRGVQYASGDYTAMLKQHQATISMSRKGNPWAKRKAISSAPKACGLRLHSQRTRAA